MWYRSMRFQFRRNVHRQIGLPTRRSTGALPLFWLAVYVLWSWNGPVYSVARAAGLACVGALFGILFAWAYRRMALELPFSAKEASREFLGRRRWGMIVLYGDLLMLGTVGATAAIPDAPQWVATFAQLAAIRELFVLLFFPRRRVLRN